MTHEPPAVVLDDSWNQEIYKLLIKLFRFRMLVAPGLCILSVAFLLLEPVPWKLLWIGTTTVLATIVVGVEAWRIGRDSYKMVEWTMFFNLATMLLLQSAMIYITGAIESPFLPVYLVLSTLAGLSPVSSRKLVTVTFIPITACLAFALGAHLSWFPRPTPSVYGIGDGFWNAPVYVWIKAGVLILFILLTTIIGATIRNTVVRATQAAFNVRKDMLETLDSRNKEILSVAGTVAHELKNPLSSIQGLAQLMSRGATPGSKDAERLDVMRREILRMTRVLDEFRNFSRPLSGLSLRKLEVSSLVNDVVALMEGLADERKVSLIAQVQSPTLLECDVQKMKQALLNLVQNALEAAPAKSSIRIEVETTHSDFIEVRVIDSGKGISSEIADRLFSPGATTKPQGSGIGLVVARSIAEQHGGSLSVSNASESGCIACLCLPRSQPKSSELLP